MVPETAWSGLSDDAGAELNLLLDRLVMAEERVVSAR